jgi:hypothetical protein
LALPLPGRETLQTPSSFSFGHAYIRCYCDLAISWIVSCSSFEHFISCPFHTKKWEF